ncbi:MAG TPA: YSC84-related protein [Patescibacteria group bacterium]|nr:YSC84-related protein [Patescibacteria group bacterium]
MRLKIFMKTLAISVGLMMLTMGVVSAATAEEKRQGIRKVTNETLNEVYQAQPKAQAVVEKAAGYAAFTITDAKLIFFGGGGGRGMSVSNRTGQEIFMGAADVQFGLGLGIKKYDVLFVFGTENALANFSDNGWEFGGQATLAATDSVNGESLEGAVSVAPDIWMYQLTDKGLEASVTVRAIRYYKEKDLN